MGMWSKTWESANRMCRSAMARGYGRVRGLMASTKGQGTTEYAILVGVLAVIAMLAVTAFKGKVTELWDAITNGMNGL